MATVPTDNGMAEEPAVEPTAAEFEAFDRFPWSKHRAFLSGLVETLGGVDALVPSPTHEGSSAFCRTVFFRMQTGRRVDLMRYNQFRVAHPAYPSVDQRLLATLYAAAAGVAAVAAAPNAAAEGGSDGGLLPATPGATADKAERSRRVVEAVARGPALDVFDGAKSESGSTAPATNGASDDDSSIPSWMRKAPTAALHVERASLRGAGAGGEAPHSDKFAKIVEAIQTGKPVEGIRQIPDTVVRRAGITPVGKLKARPKPWETAAAAAAPATPAAEADGDAAAQAAAPAGGLTSIMSVLSLGADGKEEDGPRQTAVLEFPPLPETSSEETGAETEAATAEPAATVAD